MLHRTVPGELGSYDNPIPIEKERPDLDKLLWNNRSSIWVVTPSGQKAKCYFSYADYCND